MPKMGIFSSLVENGNFSKIWWKNHQKRFKNGQFSKLGRKWQFYQKILFLKNEAKNDRILIKYDHFLLLLHHEIWSIFLDLEPKSIKIIKKLIIFAMGYHCWDWPFFENKAKIIEFWWNMIVFHCSFIMKFDQFLSN